LKKQISIIGCGWLGFPLAKTLISNGYKLKGSTTKEEKLDLLNNAGINAFLVGIDEQAISGNYMEFLSGSNLVIINIPPGLRKNPNKNHVAELEHLIEAIEAQHIPNVIFISSTSVFKDQHNFPTITETTIPDAISPNSKQLIEIEQILQDHKTLNTTIIRFGGLFDEQRHPAKHLSGRQNIQNPVAPVNLIHKNDCIAIISSVVKHNLYNITLNAVYPKHPTKEAYYSAYCKQHNFALPEFNSIEKSKGKLIDSSKLEQLLNYTFKHGL